MESRCVTALEPVLEEVRLDDPEVPHHYLMLGTGTLSEMNAQRRKAGGKKGGPHFVQNDLVVSVLGAVVCVCV